MGTHDLGTSALRAIIAAALLLAITLVSVVTLHTARAAGALAVGKCGAYGQSFDFPDVAAARDNAVGQCQAGTCRLVATIQRGLRGAFSIDGTDPCGLTAGARGPSSAGRKTTRRGPAIRPAARTA
ncbi:MAG: DUF4189 domain-containing protein [Pseudolabrys sp.]